MSTIVLGRFKGSNAYLLRLSLPVLEAAWLIPKVRASNEGVRARALREHRESPGQRQSPSTGNS
ncbi:MAG: hypothetical protein R3B37_06075 [Nitrospira sp.]|nr:hypothetical protein [Nitrospira sp.]